MGLKSWRTFIYFAKAYPKRSLFMVSALLVAGFLEGIGIITLLPLVMLLVTPGAMGEPGLITSFINGLFGYFGFTPTIGSMLTLIVVAIGFKSAITMLAMYQVAYTTAHVCADLRLSFLRNLLKGSWLHFVSLRSGASANALGTEAQRAAMAFRQGCYVMAWGVQVIVYAVVAFMVSWQITLAAIAAGGIMVFVLGFIVRSGRTAGAEQTKRLDIALARITDALFGAKPLKVMGKTDALYEVMEKDARQLQISQRNMELSIHKMQVFSEPIMVLILALGIGGVVKYGHVPVPEMLFLAALFLRMVTRVANVQTAYLTMAANESALWSILGKIVEAKKNKEPGGGTVTPGLAQGIDIKGVSFAYGTRTIFSDINLHLPPRGFCVVFGPSGEGKTTLLDLITGLYQPDAGTVSIDGYATQTLDLAQWRRMVGYVPQDVLLFHDSLRTNITLGDESVSDERIDAALRSAGAHEFVQRLEQKLATVVGERGAKLSGGERQRIAIARALIQNPKLLILDEATSALDKKTEQDVLSTVKKLSGDILILSIAHNPAALVYADRVFRLQNGKLEEMSAEQVRQLAA